MRGVEDGIKGKHRSSEDEWEVVEKAETLQDGSYVGPATFAESMAPRHTTSGHHGVTHEHSQAHGSAATSPPADPGVYADLSIPLQNSKLYCSNTAGRARVICRYCWFK